MDETHMANWMHIAYAKQEDGKLACKITSNISFYREKEIAFDIKVYVASFRVYEQFHAKPGDPIHADVYLSPGGESAGADFKVTVQGVEVVKATALTETTAQE
jgi:phage terminase large subunit